MHTYYHIEIASLQSLPHKNYRPVVYCELMFGAYELLWISGSNKSYSPCS